MLFIQVARGVGIAIGFILLTAAFVPAQWSP